MGHSKTGAKRLKKLQNAQTVHDLRLTGLSIRAIAAQTGISRAHVQRLLAEARAEAIEDIKGTAEELRALESERLDAMLASLWARRHEERVADTILRLMARRAALHGLDVKQDTTVNLTTMTPPTFHFALADGYKDGGGDE